MYDAARKDFEEIIVAGRKENGKGREEDSSDAQTHFRSGAPFGQCKANTQPTVVGYGRLWLLIDQRKAFIGGTVWFESVLWTLVCALQDGAALRIELAPGELEPEGAKQDQSTRFYYCAMALPDDALHNTKAPKTRFRRRCSSNFDNALCRYSA